MGKGDLCRASGHCGGPRAGVSGIFDGQQGSQCDQSQVKEEMGRRWAKGVRGMGWVRVIRPYGGSCRSLQACGLSLPEIATGGL